MRDITKIILFGNDTCPPCRVAKAKMDKLGIKYEYQDVDDGKEVGEYGIQSIPFMIIKYANTDIELVPPNEVFMKILDLSNVK